MLKFGAVQRCPSPLAFTADMVSLFRRECNIYTPRGINLDTVGTLCMFPTPVCEGTGSHGRGIIG
jgi:hypothetical protein